MNSHHLTTLNTLLDTFLSNYTHNNDKTQASRSLSTLTQNPDFITLAMSLLSSCQLTEHKLLLLSCMIKDKFRYDFELMPSEDIEEYYERLCELAIKFGMKCKPLFSNLSQSLALIYINQIACRELSFNDYLKRFQPDNPTDFMLYNYYFKILEQSVEAVTNTKIVLDQDSRRSAREKLINKQLEVIQTLNQSINSIYQNPTLSQVVSKECIIKCFTSWIELHYQPQIYNNLPSSSLLYETICGLKGEWYQIERSVQCLKAIIYNIQSPQQNCELYQYLGSAIHELVIHIDVKIADGNTVEMEDLIGLVVFFSQKFVEVLVRTYSNTTCGFLLSLVGYMKIGVQKIVEVLIQFWEELLTLFIDVKQQNPSSTNLTMDLPSALLHALIERCSYPGYLLKELDIVFQQRLGSKFEEGEQVYNNRNASGECFGLLANFMGSNCYIDCILQNIAALDLQDYQFFGKLEAYLLAVIPGLKKLNAVTQSVQVIVQTYQHLIRSIEYIPIKVKQTFLRVFKTILTIKLQDHSLVSKLFQFAIECLPDYMLIDNATKMICKACENNPQLLYSHISSIYNLVEKYPLEEILMRGFICLSTLKPSNASSHIIKAMGLLIDYVNNNYLDDMKFKEYVYSLDAGFKAIRDYSFESKEQVLVHIVDSLWGFIIKHLINPQANSEDQDSKIERIVKLIKTMMRVLKQNFIPYLSQLFSTVNNCFSHHPICSYVYLVEIAVTVYSKDQSEHMQQFLRDLYDSFTESALKHLQSAQSIDRYCYLIDDFLGMNSRLLVYKTTIIVASSHFERLIRFITTDCLQSNSSKAIKATYSFLHTLFMVYWSGQFFQDYSREQNEDRRDHSINQQPTITDENLYMYLNGYLQEILTTILRRMLQHLSIIPPEATKDQILDTILSSIKAFPAVNPDIWKLFLNEVGSDILLSIEKEQILWLLQKMRRQFDDFSIVKVLVEDMDGYLKLMSRRMVIADKRRRITLRD